MIGFMEPQSISTTLILETDDAISSLDVQFIEVEDCFSAVPVTIRRRFLCGDDIYIDSRSVLYTPTWFRVSTFDLHGVGYARTRLP